MSSIKEEEAIVDSLAVIMKGKLRANSHKSSWRDYENILPLLLTRLDEEVQELKDEISNPTKRANIPMECADIANICAMIADLA